MAHSDKNILITPARSNTTTDPNIVFSGADASTAAQNITLKVYPTNNGTLSFEGSAGQLFSITNSMSGTIFSVNDVSGVPSIEVLDTGSVKLAEYGGFVSYGVSQTVSAAGSTQATATPLTRSMANITGGSGGVLLPAPQPGTRIMIHNGLTSNVNVYPNSGASIADGTTNGAVVLSPSATIEYIAFTTTKWYAINAVYA